MKIKMTFLILTGWILLTGCNLGASATPTPTQPASLILDLVPTDTPLPAETFTPVPTPTATPIPPVAPAVCTDSQVTTLVDSLKNAILSSDGALLGSLVSPGGMEVRYFRNGKVLTYTPGQARFLFKTTYQANWGNDPASGMEKVGAFHETIIPELLRIFNRPYTLQCNEIRHGGASYEVAWPYKKDFYSLYYAGTEDSGYLDWHTWVVGVEYVNNKPYIYALMQFFWEP